MQQSFVINLSSSICRVLCLGVIQLQERKENITKHHKTFCIINWRYQRIERSAKQQRSVLQQTAPNRQNCQQTQQQQMMMMDHKRTEQIDRQTDTLKVLEQCQQCKRSMASNASLSLSRCCSSAAAAARSFGYLSTINNPQLQNARRKTLTHLLRIQLKRSTKSREMGVGYRAS